MLLAGMFVITFGTNISTPFLVLYQDRLDLGPSQTMAIFVVYVAGILAALLLFGPLSDTFGRKPIAIPLLGVAGLSSVLMVFGRDSLVVLLFGRLLLGAASGGFLGVASAWLLELSGRGAEQRSAVETTIATFAGFGAGPLASAFFYLLLPWPLVLPFGLHIAVTAVALGFLSRLPETRNRSGLAALRISLGVPAAAKRPFMFLVVPAAVWVFSFPATSFALFPVLVADSVDGSKVVVAALAGMITAWAGFGARPLVGRVGPRAALPVAMATGSVGYLLGTLAFTTGWWPLVLPAAFLLGGASGALTAGCLTLLGSMADNERRGALTSTFYLLAYPGMAMPLLITAVGAAWSTSAALIGVTGLACACTLLVALLQRSQRTLAT